MGNLESHILSHQAEPHANEYNPVEYLMVGFEHDSNKNEQKNIPIKYDSLSHTSSNEGKGHLKDYLWPLASRALEGRP